MVSIATFSGAKNPSRTTSPINDVIYSDLGLNFIAHPVTKKVTVLKNEDAIKRALRNLILTDSGEKFFEPLYGGNIRALLFENLDRVTEITIKENIKDTVRQFEPRVTVVDVDVNSNRIDNNDITISIIFRINESPILSELEFTVERIR